VNVSTLSAPSPQMSETDRNVCSVGRNLPVNNSTHTVQPMDTSTVCAKHINISTCAPQAHSDETSLKSTECNSGNPLLTDKLASRGRSREVRSETRSQRRSSSAVPYRRQASKSKSSAQRVLPVTKNSEPGLSGAKNSTGVQDESTIHVVVSGTQPCETRGHTPTPGAGSEVKS